MDEWWSDNVGYLINSKYTPMIVSSMSFSEMFDALYADAENVIITIVLLFIRAATKVKF